MADRRKKIFEELGLLTEAEPVNPYGVLGVDPDFARELLKEDPSGEALRVVAGGMHRVLARRYHPDTVGTGNAAKFREIDEAKKRLESASPAALTRWSRVERTSSSSQVEKLKAERNDLIRQSANVLQANFEFSNRPEHYSQFPYSQGLLLQREANMYLMTRQPNGKLRVLPGRFVSEPDNIAVAENPKTQAFDFHSFMKGNKSFGIKPGTDVRAFIDGEGRASLLTPELKFVMDITGPVQARKERRAKVAPENKNKVGIADTWAQTLSPVLISTTVADPKSKTELPPVQIVTFPEAMGNNNQRKLNWELDFEVVGSYQNQDFYSRMRHSRTLGNAALVGGGKGSAEFSYFNVLGVSASQLIQNDVGYSPLLVPGNGLLMFDPERAMPIIADVITVGMIGNDSRSTFDWE